MLIFLLLVGLSLADESPCDPNGLYDNGNCYYFYPRDSSRSVASQICHNHNSLLLIMDTPEANNIIRDNSLGYPLAWMGLKCKASNPAACFWDNLKPLPLGFSNFAPGHPNVKLGECVGYEGLTGKNLWMSTPCDNEMYFVCSQPVKFKPSPKAVHF